ncbi:MAG TPA: hypothetical protein VGF84_05415 [Micromonosporaceae bacterium]
MTAVALEARPFGVAIAVVATCALLIGLALSLPERAPEGVVLGIGTTLSSMLAVAHPGRPLVPLTIYLATTFGALGVALANAPPAEPVTGVRFWARMLRLGAFWLAVPSAVVAAVTVRTDGAGAIALVACLGVFVLVYAAARRRGRDLSVGYVSGLLVGLAALVASAYGQAAGDGAVLGYPADLTGLLALGCAGRIGVDRAFAGWQRIAALSIGAATLVAVSSPVAFVAALVACAAYVIFRLRTVRMPHQLRDRLPVATARMVAPFAVLGVLWAVSALALPSGRDEVTDFTPVAAFGSTGTVGRLLGYAPPAHPLTFAPTGWIGMVALIVGAALVVWRVTGPGLPLWVPTVGLAMLAGVLASRSGSSYGPSPAWVLVLAAELWVFCHGLRTDRNVTQPPPLPDD